MEKTPPWFTTFFQIPEKKAAERTGLYFTMNFPSKQAIS